MRLAEFVSTQSEVFDAFANQEANLRELLQELPSTLEETRSALASGETPGQRARAGLRGAHPRRPGVRGAASSPPSVWRARRSAPIRDQIRPFTKQARPTLRHLEPGAEPLGKTVKASTGTFSELNNLFNAWAYNPDGPEEGHMFWTAWLNHNTNNTASFQDAHGALPRGLVMQACQTALRAEELATVRPVHLDAPAPDPSARIRRHLPTHSLI